MILPSSRPRLTEPSGDVDVAIVGAGAAGISAARACLAASLSVAVLEARPWICGRAVTASFAGHPIDLGAHWLHAGELNPLVPLARSRGEKLRRASAGGGMFLDGRSASREEQRLHGEAFGRADLAFARAGRADEDSSLERAMPPLGRWGGPIRATMALISGRPLAEVSAKDFPSDEFGDNYFVRGGYGAYLARLALDLPVRLGSPVSRIDWSGTGVRLAVPDGEVRARAVIVTAPMPVVASGALRFHPALPIAAADAASSFLPGAYEHVILNWPFGTFHGPDRLVKLVTGRDSVGLLANMDGAPFHYLELDHRLASNLPDGGARMRFARRFLSSTFGHRAISHLRILGTTDWTADPFSRCAWAVVPPGRVSAREEIGRPIGDRIWFAGEANSDSLWGTVGGAWEEGEKAARAVAARLGAGSAP